LNEVFLAFIVSPRVYMIQVLEKHSRPLPIMKHMAFTYHYF